MLVGKMKMTALSRTRASELLVFGSQRTIDAKRTIAHEGNIRVQPVCSSGAGAKKKALLIIRKLPTKIAIHFWRQDHTFAHYVPAPLFYATLRSPGNPSGVSCYCRASSLAGAIRQWE